MGNITQTDFGYTGQRALNNGLMDYHARFYDAYINRWTQPDSIVPNAVNSQNLNHYSYVLNRPIILSDPSGHDPWWCDTSSCYENYNRSDNRIVYVGSYIAGLNIETLGQQAEDTYSGGPGGAKVSGVSPDVPVLLGQEPADLPDPSGPIGLANDVANSAAPSNKNHDVFIYMGYSKIDGGVSINDLYVYNQSDYNIYIFQIKFLARDKNGKLIQDYNYACNDCIGVDNHGYTALINPHTNSHLGLKGTSVNLDNVFKNATVNITIAIFDPPAANITRRFTTSIVAR
jgi:RHS repeat-associated protein